MVGYLMNSVLLCADGPRVGTVDCVMRFSALHLGASPPIGRYVERPAMKLNDLSIIGMLS